MLRSSDLLKYYEQYGIVICRTCQFAVQPSALASHLLKHQIYRGERQRLLSQLCKLKLHDPGAVVDPPAGNPPVPELPVYKGFSCLAPSCDHVCASVKRMSQHWSESHGVSESRNVQARDCWLQTFFRGNKIRYFEVGAPLMPVQDDVMLAEATPSTQSGDISENKNPHLDELPPPPPLDMVALRYLHHFTTVVSLTLPRTDLETTYHWSNTVVQEAFLHPFLMYGLLGLSAFHLSKTLYDPLEARRHAEASIRYQNSSLADFRDLHRRPDSSNAVALIAYARAIGIQRCCRIPDCVQGSADLRQLVEFLHLIRGNTETLISLQQLLPEGSDFKLPIEEVEYLTRQDDSTSFADPTNSTSKVPPDLLQRLTSLPRRIYQTPEEYASPNAKATISATSTLISSFQRVYSCPSLENPSGRFVGSPDSEAIAMVWTGMEYWSRFVPDQYIRMLEEGNQAALILFAHWCHLLRSFGDRYWYCHGLPERLQTWILANLDDELKEFVADLI